MTLENRKISRAHVYGIVGHAVDNYSIPDGIELYTKELVKIRLELGDLLIRTSSESIIEYGLVEERDFKNLLGVVWFLLWNFERVINEQNTLQEIEHEYQLILGRISKARKAMVMGRVGEVESIESSNYSQRPTERVMIELLHDGTFAQELEKIDSAANRVDQRLSGMREATNARRSLTISISTVLITVLLLAFSILTFLTVIASLVLA